MPQQRGPLSSAFDWWRRRSESLSCWRALWCRIGTFWRRFGMASPIRFV